MQSECSVTKKVKWQNIWHKINKTEWKYFYIKKQFVQLVWLFDFESEL